MKREPTRAELQKKLDKIVAEARTMSPLQAKIGLYGLRELSRLLDDSLQTVIASGLEPDLETYRYTKRLVGRLIRMLRARARA